MLAAWKKSYEQPRQHIKKQRHYFANKGLSSQGYGFSSGHVWMWELDCEQSWTPKNWCFGTVVLEKTPESPLDCKEVQPVHSKGDQLGISSFIEEVSNLSHSIFLYFFTLFTYICYSIPLIVLGIWHISLMNQYN